MTKLTISRALREIARIKSELKEWTERRRQAVSHKADATPAYDFATTSEQVAKLTEELIGLQSRVAAANATVVVDTDGSPASLARIIHTLAQIKSEIEQLRALKCLPAKEVTELEDQYIPATGYLKVPVKTVSHLTIRERDEVVARLQTKFNYLNDLVEQANHSNFC